MIGTLKELKQLFLPKETDFMAMLHQHVKEINTLVQTLLQPIENMEQTNALLKAGEEALRSENRALLDSFITPYDREALYRIINQLIWLKMSIRHFLLALHAFKNPTSLHPILTPLAAELQTLSAHLLEAIVLLQKRKTQQVNDEIVQLFNAYERFIEHNIALHTTIMHFTDTQQLFMAKELSSQLKDIAKRLRVCAMSVDDLLMKSY